MSDAFSVDVSEVLRLAQGSRAAATLVPQELARAMERSVVKVEADAKTLAPVDTGNLRRSITHDVAAQAGGAVGKVGTNVPYGRYVEEGTSAHWPPVSALAGWAARHGIEPFLVARAISRRGTKARPYLRPALAKNLSAIDAEFKQVAVRVLAKLGGR